jgi:hypothetical protein
VRAAPRRADPLPRVGAAVGAEFGRALAVRLAAAGRGLTTAADFSAQRGVPPCPTRSRRIRRS